MTGSGREREKEGEGEKFVGVIVEEQINTYKFTGFLSIFRSVSLLFGLYDILFLLYLCYTSVNSVGNS